MPGGLHRICCCDDGGEPPPDCCQCLLQLKTYCNNGTCDSPTTECTPCCGIVQVVTVPNNIACPGTWGVVDCRTNVATGVTTCNYDTCADPAPVLCYPHSPNPGDYAWHLTFPGSIDCEGTTYGFCWIDVSGCSLSYRVYIPYLEIDIPAEGACDPCSVLVEAFYSIPKCFTDEEFADCGGCEGE